MSDPPQPLPPPPRPDPRGKPRRRGGIFTLLAVLGALLFKGKGILLFLLTKAKLLFSLKYLGVLLKFAHENRVVTAPVRERLAGKSLQALVRLLSEERKVLLSVRPAGSSGRASLDPERVVAAGDELVYIDIL